MNTENLIVQLIENSPSKYINRVKSAISFAQKYHLDQYRLSGEPYINHGLRTAITLAEMGLDTNTIVAGLLHNSTHNQSRSKDEIYLEIKENFGKDVYNILITLHDISKATGSPDTQPQIITRFILNYAKDLRAIQ